MYFPYFRGKQYELITIRENATRLAAAGFIPVIEPVKETLGGLEKALTAVSDASGKAIVIVNPYHGSLKSDGESISALLKEKFLNGPVAVGILLKSEMQINDVLEYCGEHSAHELALVHAGFTQGKALSEAIDRKVNIGRHIFAGDLNKLYRKHFQSNSRVLVKDGFTRRKRNADHPPIEKFSELHVTYKTEEGMDGFGDFLTVGDDYLEGGGPAYAIAIHLTFIDPSDDDVMYIYHFKSKRSDTPTDPAGKFAEAIAEMINELDKPECKVLESAAVQEFRSLHARKHFPGLGYVKKLSMQHHIETLAHYFAIA